MIDTSVPGSSVVRSETCSLATVRRVAAMLDLDPDAWQEGDPLPCGWHFVLLGADTRRSALRADGFPGLGVPLPDLGLPRLMLGGRTVRFGGDIPIGTTLRRESRVQKLSRKDGANGPMAVVTLAHDLYLPQAAEPVLVETQTYILLGAQASTRKPTEAPPTPLPRHTKRVVPDGTLLFQYSALGFNSHRIHLDREFACTVVDRRGTLALTHFWWNWSAVFPRIVKGDRRHSANLSGIEACPARFRRGRHGQR